MNNQEPKWILKWLKKFCAEDLIEGIEGDLFELFELESTRYSVSRARRRYTWRALGFFRVAFINKRKSITHQLFTMIGNYLKISVRSALKNKTSSFVNLLGLTLGLAACGFLAQYIYQEWSYDRHFENHDRIYRLTLDMEFGDDMTKLAISPSGFGKVVTEKSGQVEGYAMLRRYSNIQFKKDNDLIKTSRIYQTEAGLQDILNYEWLSGNAQTALQRPYSIVLTKSLSEKVLSTSTNPIGQILTRDNNDQYTVTGVIADPPITSHIHPEAFISLEDPSVVNQMDAWRWVTYVKVIDQFDQVKFTRTLADISTEIFGVTGGSGRGRIFIQQEKLTDIHFITDRKFEMEANDGNRIYLQGFSILIILILSMSIINYVNLTIAQTYQRLKEVSVRRTFGAQRPQIIAQFFFESALMIGLSAIFSLVIIISSQTLFQNYAGIELSIFQIIEWKTVLLITLLLVTVLGLSSIYPALRLSGIKAFQKELKIKSNKFSSALLLFQMALSCLVLIGTTIVYQQYEFMTSQNLGFDQTQVITTKMDDNANKNYWVIHDKLMQLPEVESVSSAEHTPGEMAPINNFEYTTKDGVKKMVCPHIWVDQHYLETLQLNLVAGQNFEDYRGYNGKRIGVIINETFARESGWTPEEAIGQTLKSGTTWEDKIIGVVKDFHLVSLHHVIEPMVIRHIVGGRHLMVKTKSQHYQQLMRSIDQIWQETAGTEQAQFAFLDKQFQQQYDKDQKQAELFAGFSFLIIFISLAGLFGLTTYTVQRRLKEMSIRKIHGASASQILTLMIKEFGYLSLLAAFLAIPAAYYVFTRWLENFAYTIELQPVYLMLPALLLITLIVFTAAIRSYKVVHVNPANVLRDE
ncbi:FtsX-like permease family protein [Marinoscillum sp.]|uniref:FtsX-like permease family protein n=1 Tax=Marinoscillum sp. TaxID=2024838 RepID=UPI003BAD27C9